VNLVLRHSVENNSDLPFTGTWLQFSSIRIFIKKSTLSFIR